MQQSHKSSEYRISYKKSKMPAASPIGIAPLNGAGFGLKWERLERIRAFLFFFREMKFPSEGKLYVAEYLPFECLILQTTI
ncbi:hypothetical protein TH62_02045 [Bacillus sp. TH008]|nr:hypothetical protein TH62_02045 [Bacillus sp. TH008]